jgi:hypothetical protein
MSVYKTANLNRNNKNTFLKHILSSQFSTHQLKRYVIISHRKRKYNFLKQNQIDPPLPVPPLSCCGTFLKNSFFSRQKKASRDFTFQRWSLEAIF